MTQPFNFRYFGTFSGPQYQVSDYNYDASSQEGTWHTLLPGDYAFKNNDLGAYLYNSQADYVGFHCDYVATSMMTLEASYGNIPVFNVFASKTNVNGDINTIGNINSVGNITANGFITHNGSFNLSGVGDIASYMQTTRTIASSKKSFDISHPSKENHRLRYICLEGPEAAVYYRGRLKGTVIELPDYWKDLVDADTITVNLTPHGSYQELYVKSIEWGTKIQIRNANGGSIDCSFVVCGERKDVAKNIPEYQGNSPFDYPGDNKEYTVAGYKEVA
jgi:hypothetical protein